jgi:hypothetical protein
VVYKRRTILRTLAEGDPRWHDIRIDENAAMADAVRVRLYWEDGTVETAHEPIDAAVTVIIRQAKDGTHRHFEVTDDIDADGYVIALELPD